MLAECSFRVQVELKELVVHQVFVGVLVCQISLLDKRLSHLLKAVKCTAKLCDLLHSAKFDLLDSLNHIACAV